ncbi:MAG TPA: response regulator [Rhodocyclaceae bacterium]|nr:response regulator [Rhodocyclaceae bacterium]
MAIQRGLVVDDSPTERQVLSDFLTKQGMAVLTAEDGEQAVACARTEQPDLILMDVVMPGMNGYQATRVLARDEATRHIPIIMCTSKDQPTDRIWGMRQGALDYLTKPVDLGALMRTIQALQSGASS